MPYQTNAFHKIINDIAHSGNGTQHDPCHLGAII